MNLLDLLLLVVLVAAGVGGYRVGFLARTASWVGALGGFVVAAFTVPLILGLVTAGGPQTRILIGVITFLGTVLGVSAVANLIGLRAGRAVRRTALGPVDQAAGVVAGVLGVFVAVWFLSPAAADVPGAVASQVRNSAIVNMVRGVAPNPPDAISGLRSLVDRSGFPEVFSEFGPAPETGPPPSQIPVPPEVVQRVTQSTVNVEVVACGYRSEGSGFTVEPGIVVTNAHVVAGAESVVLRRPDGAEVEAEVLVLDDDRDLAVLRGPGLDQQPLPLAATEAGAQGAAIGYPNGQDQPRTQPVAVEQRRVAVGRDIYGEDRVERRILVLAASLQRGDSGGPIIDQAGQVVGATFAVAADRSATAFALDVEEIRAVLQAPREPGSNGKCV